MIKDTAQMLTSIKDAPRTQSLHTSIDTDAKKSIRFSANNNDVKPYLKPLGSARNSYVSLLSSAGNRMVTGDK